MIRGRGGRLFGALMVAVLMHAGSLANLPATEGPNAEASGTSMSVTMRMDDIRGRGWWKKAACVVCAGMSVGLSTVSGGLAAGTLVGCAAACALAFADEF